MHFGCLYIRDVISLNTYACLHTRLGSWRVRAVFCSPLCSWGLVRSPPQKSCFINVCWQSRSHQRQTFTSAALPLPSTYLFSSLNVVGKPRVATHTQSLAYGLEKPRWDDQSYKLPLVASFPTLNNISIFFYFVSSKHICFIRASLIWMSFILKFDVSLNISVKINSKNLKWELIFRHLHRFLEKYHKILLCYEIA